MTWVCALFRLLAVPVSSRTIQLVTIGIVCGGLLAGCNIADGRHGGPNPTLPMPEKGGIPTSVQPIANTGESKPDQDNTGIVSIDPSGRERTPETNPVLVDLVLLPPAAMNITAGDRITHAVTIQNRGPNGATGVKLIYQLPSGLSPDGETPVHTLCKSNQGQITCTMGELADGAAAIDLLLPFEDIAEETISLPDMHAWCVMEEGGTTTDLVCSLSDLPAAGEIQFETRLGADAAIAEARPINLVVTAQEREASPGDNQATIRVNILAAESQDQHPDPTMTDLAVHFQGPTTIIAGEPFSTTFLVSNQGQQSATNVRLNYTLPAATTLENYTPAVPDCQQTGTTFTCQLLDPVSERIITVRIQATGLEGEPVIMQLDPLQPGWPLCTVLKERTYLHILECALGRLQPGQSRSIQTTHTAEGIQARDLVVVASVQADQPDYTPLDNSVDLTIPVAIQADLSIELRAPTRMQPDQTYVYRLIVRNHGPSDATEVTVTETLPANVHLHSVHPSQGNTCLETKGRSLTRVECRIGRLEQGRIAAIAVRVAQPPDYAAERPALIRHSSRVEAVQGDPRPQNNVLTESFTLVSGN